MNREPVVVREGDLEWESWPDEDVAKRGLVYWKTLVSSDVTHSNALTMGIAKIPPGEALRKHRHRQAEIYFILEGTGLVEIDSEARSVTAGSTVFIPGDAVALLREHGCVGLALRLRFPRRFVRGDRVHLRGVTQNYCPGVQPELRPSTYLLVRAKREDHGKRADR